MRLSSKAYPLQKLVGFLAALDTDVNGNVSGAVIGGLDLSVGNQHARHAVLRYYLGKGGGGKVNATNGGDADQSAVLNKVHEAIISPVVMLSIFLMVMRAV